MDDSLVERTASLREICGRYPYKPENYDNLIECLRLNKSNKDEIFVVREKKRGLFKWRQEDLAGYQEDIASISDKKKKEQVSLEFYSRLKEEYPIAENWVNYIEHLIALRPETVVPSIYDEALEDCEYDYQESYKVWNYLITIALSLFEEGQLQFDSVFQLYLRRLSRPQNNLDGVFSEVSQFVSKNKPNDYEKYMVKANSMYQKTSKSMRYYEMFELPLAKDPTNVELWSQYLDQIYKYSKKDHTLKQLRTTFFRALTAGGILRNGQNQWIPVWLTFIYCLYDLGNSQLAREYLKQFLQTYPYSCLGYAEFIRNIQENPKETSEFLVIRQRIQECDLMNSSDYDSWKTLATTLLAFEYKCVEDLGIVDFMNHLFSDIDKFVNHALENNDIFHTVEKTAITIFEKLDEIELAEKILQGLVELFNAQCEVWLFFYEFKKRNGASAAEISAVFESSLESILEMDWPERILLEWLSFAQLNESSEANKKLVVRADEILKAITEYRMNTSTENYISNSVGTKRSLEVRKEELPSKKQKTEATEDFKRNRELFTIKVTNLPKTTTENHVKDFFKECGDTKEIILFKENDGISCRVEFHSEQEVLAALTKGFKKFQDNEISITRFFEATVWVTNYPPSLSQDQIKDMFSKVGNVISARFPSQKAKHDRRFCYIEFGDPQHAMIAKKMLNDKEIEDPLDNKRYTLKVEISDPSRKRERNESSHTNEAFIQNLDFKIVTSDILRDFFSGCGEIEQIRLPVNDKGVDKGYHNSGFGFINFKTDVGLENALKLNGASLSKRPIKISRSKSKADQNRQPLKSISAFDDSKSISLFNVNDTLTAQQLRSHITQKVGDVNKLELFPKSEAALVEFANSPDAGKASMILNSQDLAGSTLTVGLKRDLLQKLHNPPTAKTTHNQPPVTNNSLLAPPTLMRRRKR